MKQSFDTVIHNFHEDFPCAYFGDGRVAAVECLIADRERLRRFDEFLARGYRRLGNILYRHVCKHCADCLPLRIEVGRFAPSRSQKRTLRRNGDIGVDVLETPALTYGKIALYEKYIRSKHGDDGAPEGQRFEHLLLLYHGYPRTIEMNYYLGSKLIGVGLVDEGDDSLSSNYFFYDTDHLDRRPGVLSILHEIALARTRGKRYYYLGFYIEGTEKMAYKKHFRPNQILRSGRWEEFTA